jgi:hypothetical protein
MEEEKKRIHFAQGLPWTTDEVEVCVTSLFFSALLPFWSNVASYIADAIWENRLRNCCSNSSHGNSKQFIRKIDILLDFFVEKIQKFLAPKVTLGLLNEHLLLLLFIKTNLSFFTLTLFQCLLKPPVKERTEPVDLVLHSDIRAVERAEFDQYVSLLQARFCTVPCVKPNISGTNWYFFNPFDFVYLETLGVREKQVCWANETREGAAEGIGGGRTDKTVEERACS